ncbi:unnamed protein product [Adineta ricciae]|uniref:Uncharacterized protein n=1 Tax=Adineta ricciae TaxID=249248 RepID=A0A815BQ23_ADIRI|nr:unnamed protein product [Adineta ricciae]
MNDATAALAGHTKKYNIPLSHFEYKYIQDCTNGKELEKIYKELTSGEVGSFPDLEKLTLERIQQVKPKSQILRKDEAPLDRSALPDDECRDFDDFLNQMKEVNKKPSILATTEHQNNGLNSAPIRNKSIISKPTTPVQTASVINKNGKSKRIVPRSYEEWGKLDQKLSKEMDGDNDDDDDDDHDTRKPTTESRPVNSKQTKADRLRTAEQHRLDGNSAFRSNKYQQAIDHYTKSITHDDANSVVYMNRAIAYFKVDNYDASLSDCSKVLMNDPSHIKALFRRASCFLAKQQYDDAKCDLDNLLNVDPENTEAKNLLKTIPTIQKPRGVRIPITEDDDEDEEMSTSTTMTTTIVQPPATTSVKIPILEVDEEEDEEMSVKSSQQPSINQSVSSMNIDIPRKTNSHAQPCIDSQEASPAMFDHHFQHRDDIHQFQESVHSQLSSFHAEDGDDNDNDDDMELGDEAGANALENMSDDDRRDGHSLNVSPTMEDDDIPELIGEESIEIQSSASSSRQRQNSNTIDRNIPFSSIDTFHRDEFSAIANDDHASTLSNKNHSTYKRISENRSSSTLTSQNDQISNSNFSPIVQSWLRDSQSNHHSSSLSDKPWSKLSRPYELDRLQRDIERFNRLNDNRNALEAAKKMLKNGLLDYHRHAEHIMNTLMVCAQCNAKLGRHSVAIQYATEALQYNRTDANVLICRGRAFEAENLFLFSYADYIRIPSTDYNYALMQRACEKLIPDLEATEGINWREKLPKDNDDAGRYLTYIKTKTNYSDDKQYEWYRERGNQLYMDACFVLAIQWYTHCIDLNSNVAFLYSNRAACYLKVFEPYKAIDDCDKALKIDPKNVRALYRKASAYKMTHNRELHESTLKDLLKIEPNNQTILNEYYTSRREPIPREMRRLRTNPAKASENNSLPEASTPSSHTQVDKPSTNTIEGINLSYDELEQIRAQKLLPLSTNTPYQFTQQLNALKPSDTKSQCSLVLRIPPKGLYKLASAASAKLVEFIANACRIMVFAEKRYQHENKSLILPFSYASFCYNLLSELVTLQRIESAVAMVDDHCRLALDDLLTYYSSMPSLFPDIKKLDRLRK